MKKVTVTRVNRPHENCHCAKTIDKLTCRIHYLSGWLDAYERILDQLVGNG